MNPRTRHHNNQSNIIQHHSINGPAVAAPFQLCQHDLGVAAVKPYHSQQQLLLHHHRHLHHPVSPMCPLVFLVAVATKRDLAKLLNRPRVIPNLPAFGEETNASTGTMWWRMTMVAPALCPRAPRTRCTRCEGAVDAEAIR